MMGQKGFTLIEALIALGLITLFLVMGSHYSAITTKNTNLTRYIGTKNRVLATIRETIALPATMRASMLAATNGAAVNPALLACAGGNPIKACTNGGPLIPFTLFSPMIGRDTNGNVLGVQAVSSPQGQTTDPIRINSFGAVCTVASPDCALLIYTAMRAQCGPAVAPASPPPTNANTAPQAVCTFAELIEVTYTIQLDTSVTDADPSLASFITPVTNKITISVMAISGNVSK